jgi:arylsulfatase A-like enzyme
VLIVSDDVGYADLGFQGCHDIPTPHIDSIAAAGVRFTNGYVSSPVCSPTRAGLLTGRYQQRFGHEFNPGKPQPTDLAEGALPQSERTIAEALQEAGYATAIVGKWHLGSSKLYWPLQRGFDEYYGFLGGNHPYLPGKGGGSMIRGNKKVDEPAHLTQEFGREAAVFIKRQTKAGKPFFLYLPFNAAHTPLQPDQEHLARFQSIADPKRRKYAALISGMDDAIGEVLDALNVSGKIDDTMVVFVNDNGGPQEANGSSNAPLRGDKLTLWEGGIRVPFAIRWKDKIPAGVTYTHPVISLDVTATVASAAGATLGEPKRAIDGIDLLPYLQGQKKEPPHKSLYWRFGTQHAIRQGDYKLLQFAEGPTQLYDLAADMVEKHDIASAHPEIVQRLESVYKDWNSELIDPLWKRDKMGGKPGRPGAGPRSHMLRCSLVPLRPAESVRFGAQHRVQSLLDACPNHLVQMPTKLLFVDPNYTSCYTVHPAVSLSW